MQLTVQVGVAGRRRYDRGVRYGSPDLEPANRILQRFFPGIIDFNPRENVRPYARRRARRRLILPRCIRHSTSKRDNTHEDRLESRRTAATGVRRLQFKHIGGAV